MLKRCFDIFCSGIGLLILSPLFLLVAVWVKCDSQGPVFYRQIRVGRFGRDFK
ncbi:MAG: sugar transferase, partial [Bacteroidales bacterium]|nr:sugar transferase [Bacteroidales bacterium]